MPRRVALYILRKVLMNKLSSLNFNATTITLIIVRKLSTSSSVALDNELQYHIWIRLLKTCFFPVAKIKFKPPVSIHHVYHMEDRLDWLFLNITEKRMKTESKREQQTHDRILHTLCFFFFFFVMKPTNVVCFASRNQIQWVESDTLWHMRSSTHRHAPT